MLTSPQTSMRCLLELFSSSRKATLSWMPPAATGMTPPSWPDVSAPRAKSMGLTSRRAKRCFVYRGGAHWPLDTWPAEPFHALPSNFAVPSVCSCMCSAAPAAAS